MTDTDRQHLARILGMLGSDHAGERAAAGLQAEAFRRKHRLTWTELFIPAPAETDEPMPAGSQFEQWPPYEPIQWHKVVLLTCFWLAILIGALAVH
jgi:hypothetical protein